MELSEQVVSLELGKRLKSLGVKQDSLFYWVDAYTVIPHLEYMPNYMFSDRLSAFTVAELLSILPIRVTLTEGEPYNSFTFFMKKSFIVKGEYNPEKIELTEHYLVNYECDSTACSGHDAWIRRMLISNCVIAEENPANALAEVLIYLLENEIMELKND